MGENIKSKRNSNIELLRILAMLMIIVYFYIAYRFHK